MALVTIHEKVGAPQQIIKTVAASGTPEAITSTSPTYFSNAIYIGLKAVNPRTANSGIVYLGVTSGNETQPIAINPSEVYSISAPTGVIFDLSTWYLDVATNGDGVVVIYS